jgi:hypothetical protein
MHLSTIFIDVKKEVRARNGEVVKKVLEKLKLKRNIEEFDKLIGNRRLIWNMRMLGNIVTE